MQLNYNILQKDYSTTFEKFKIHLKNSKDNNSWVK